MIVVKFCRNWKKDYVGWCEYENGHYFSKGRTLDVLIHNMKMVLYQKKRVSGAQVVIDSKPTNASDCPVQYMSAMFRGKNWKEYPEEEVAKPAPEVFDSHEYVVEDGVLVVYGVRRVKIAEYKNAGGAQHEA